MGKKSQWQGESPAWLKNQVARGCPMENATKHRQASPVRLAAELALSAFGGAILGAVCFRLAGLPAVLGGLGGSISALILVLLVRALTAPAQSSDPREAFTALREGVSAGFIWGVIWGTCIGLPVQALLDVYLYTYLPLFVYSFGGGFVLAAAYAVGWAVIHLLASTPDRARTNEPGASFPVDTDE
jgi:hypothetical protein